LTQKPKKKQKIFIEALEQRIMLDGAGASTFLDLIDERNQEEIKKNSKIIDTTKDNNEVPFANTARDQNKKNVVLLIVLSLIMKLLLIHLKKTLSFI
jgi:hypothetical protein